MNHEKVIDLLKLDQEAKRRLSDAPKLSLILTNYAEVIPIHQPEGDAA